MYSKKYTIVSYLFVTILGVLCHFAYDWSGENFIVGMFCPVNESTWEHLKLAFFPMLLLTLWDLSHNFKDNADFLPARTMGIFLAMAFIVTAFYTYIGVIGKTIDPINIVIYFIGIAFGFWMERLVFGKTKWFTPALATLLLIAMSLAFVILTYLAPDVGIFKDPLA
ncbi:MAG: DUF6512 family protein [Faecalimonas sp.]|nr:DUF6512 family protein [Faecalimonas sp.]